MGPAGIHSKLHVDIWHTDAWLCNLQGRKRFSVFHPAYGRPPQPFLPPEAPDPPSQKRHSSSRAALASVLDGVKPGERGGGGASREHVSLGRRLGASLSAPLTRRVGVVATAAGTGSICRRRTTRGWS
jgi:hypothetical protein